MSDINITPLIDVMLVLLIIFMVVTPARPEGPGHRAAPGRHPTQPSTPHRRRPNQVVLGLDDDGRHHVNKSPVATMEELDSRLKDIFQTRSDKTMFVKASGKVPYGKVVEAMDVAKGAGVERIGIISEKMIAGTPGGGAAGRRDPRDPRKPAASPGPGLSPRGSVCLTLTGRRDPDAASAS